MSSTERGIFDGQYGFTSTTIFDTNLIFDVFVSQPIAADVLTVFVHGNQIQSAMVHGNEVIPRRIQ